MRFFALVAFLAPAIAWADVAPPPPPKAPANRPAAKSPRVTCGCPTASFLSRGPVSLSDGKQIAAWLHFGAHVEPYGRDDSKKLVPLDAELKVDELLFEGEHSPSSSRLVRLSGAFPDGSWLGMLRKNETQAKDFIEVKS